MDGISVPRGFSIAQAAFRYLRKNSWGPFFRMNKYRLMAAFWPFRHACARKRIGRRADIIESADNCDSCPFAAGGPTRGRPHCTDNMARSLGQTFVIENVSAPAARPASPAPARQETTAIPSRWASGSTRGAALYPNLPMTPAADFRGRSGWRPARRS